MTQRIVGIVVTLIASGNAIASDPIAPPKHVPPVMGTAVVSDPGGFVSRDGIDFERYDISLTLPRIAWQVVYSPQIEAEVEPRKSGRSGAMQGPERWPQLKAEVELVTIVLRINDRPRLVQSCVKDIGGKQLRRHQVLKQLEKETPVLVSLSGSMPDPYFLQLTKPDAMIVILGPGDGYPAPEYLPAIKVSSTPIGKATQK